MCGMSIRAVAAVAGEISPVFLKWLIRLIRSWRRVGTVSTTIFSAADSVYVGGAGDAAVAMLMMTTWGVEVGVGVEVKKLERRALYFL